MAAAKTATGHFTYVCRRAAFFLTKVDGLDPKEKLTLSLSHYGPVGWETAQEDWEDVAAERCGTDGKCERAIQAKIWLNKSNPDDKRVSGKYDVNFQGQHVEGTFVVKYRKIETVCE